jgi:hypothetical protein
MTQRCHVLSQANPAACPPVGSPRRAPARRLAAVALACCSLGVAHADITTSPGGQPITIPGPGGTTIAACPFDGLSYLCVVEAQARVNGPTGLPLEKVRIGRTSGYLNSAGLDIGAGAQLTLTSNVANADVVVGDNVGVAAMLTVRNGGLLSINEPFNGNGSGGLIVGAFSAPVDAPPGLGNSPLPTTSLLISDGGVVNVNKPGGFNVASAVASGYGPGSNSSIVLDGGIGNFGSPALGATLNTTGNLSIGRLGTGQVTLLRNATLTASATFMSTIAASGQSSLFVGFQSTLSGPVYAGIGLNATTGIPDPTVAAHGTGLVNVQSSGFISGIVTLGSGGQLSGSGQVLGVNNQGGLVSPGNSPGTLTIGSGGLNSVGGGLLIEFGSSGRDRLIVGGPVTLNGTTVQFSFIEGYAPTAGDSFEFITTGGVMPNLTGVQYTVSGLQPGFQFNVLTGASGQLVFNALTNGVALVPEPGSVGLMLLGLLGVATVTARQRR